MMIRLFRCLVLVCTTAIAAAFLLGGLMMRVSMAYEVATKITWYLRVLDVLTAVLGVAVGGAAIYACLRIAWKSLRGAVISGPLLAISSISMPLFIAASVAANGLPTWGVMLLSVPLYLLAACAACSMIMAHAMLKERRSSAA